MIWFFKKHTETHVDEGKRVTNNIPFVNLRAIPLKYETGGIRCYSYYSLYTSANTQEQLKEPLHIVGW